MAPTQILAVPCAALRPERAPAAVIQSGLEESHDEYGNDPGKAADMVLAGHDVEIHSGAHVVEFLEELRRWDETAPWAWLQLVPCRVGAGRRA